ncbi:MAG: hypothetical protein ABIU54_06140 [Candidatus Eisenbacteria bacterium]
MFEPVEEGRTSVGRDACVDRGRADALMPQVILDDLEWQPSVEQVRRDGVPQTVAGQITAETCGVAVAREQGLNASLLERSASPSEQWGLWSDTGVELTMQQGGGGLEDDLLALGATLGATDEDTTSIQVDVPALHQGHLSHPESVVVYQCEQRLVPGIGDHGEEAPNFVLGEIPRKPERNEAELWGGVRHGWRNSRPSARFSERVHCLIGVNFNR